MPLFWHSTSFPGEQVGVWEVTEELDELEGMIPAAHRKADPTPFMGNLRKRKERCAVRALIHELHPKALPLTYDGGRPVSNDPGLRLSISHDGELVAVQLVPKGCPTGIDLQRLRPEKLERVAPRFSCQEEIDLLKEMEEKERAEAANILWCTKEALFKEGAPSAFREGIRVEAFHPENEGELVARTGMNGQAERRFKLRYRRFDAHHLVHIVGEEFI